MAKASKYRQDWRAAKAKVSSVDLKKIRDAKGFGKVLDSFAKEWPTLQARVAEVRKQPNKRDVEKQIKDLEDLYASIDDFYNKKFVPAIGKKLSKLRAQGKAGDQNAQKAAEELAQLLNDGMKIALGVCTLPDNLVFELKVLKGKIS